MTAEGMYDEDRDRTMSHEEWLHRTRHCPGCRGGRCPAHGTTVPPRTAVLSQKEKTELTLGELERFSELGVTIRGGIPCKK